MDDLPGLLPVAIEAATRGAAITRERAPSMVTAKGSARDMTTDVDLAVEEAVREFLAEEAPGISFLGEEYGLLGESDAGAMWVLDPIDGTANFVHGVPLCAISLGLVAEGETSLGVIVLPFLDACYHAMKEHGAYLNNERIAVRRSSTLASAVVSMGDYEVGPGSAKANRTALAVAEVLAANVQRVRMLGSAAIDLAWVADGKLDGTIILSNEPWDTSAGALLAQESGAIVMDRSGKPHELTSTATIALAPTLASELFPLLSAILDG